MGDMLATLYDPIIAPFDFFGVRRWRQWATRAARGHTLEIGVGTGLNLPYYRAVESVAAIDPDGASLQRALNRRNGRGEIVSLYQARAEDLPFADESFDAVVGTLTFCSIGDPARALREVRRVLRDDATFWLVIGDSYTSGNRDTHGTRVGYKQATNRGMCGENNPPRAPMPPGLKPKDLIGIPWKVAMALQAVPQDLMEEDPAGFAG
jgi:SAM-dependent methyltransferase